MHLTSILLLLVVTLFLVLILHAEEGQSLYPYTIRGLVADVRNFPFRFIGGLFFKKAFFLKKLKLKWKLKKKFVLKKLLKKLFLGAAALGTRGRKRRAIRFPDEYDNGSGSGSNGGSGSGSSSSLQFNDHHYPERQLQSSSSGSSSSRTFFDEENFSEFRSIGLGQQELEMLRELPENLQFEYRQEMQELETSASEPREADIMEYLSATNEFDTNHCIARLTCEVMARGNRTSNQFENFILDYYNEEPESRKDPKGAAAYVYDYAAFLGKSRRDSRACANYFPKCPESTNQLTSFMNDIFSSEMCDGPALRNEL